MPYFSHSNGGDEKMGRVLGIVPRGEVRIGSGFFRLADRIRVEHEVHKRTALTRSSGIRGGSQSVVKRTEFCHAFNFFIENRALGLRRVGRDDRFREVPLTGRADSQPNNSRACRSDSFLTFLTATSTALMKDILAKNQLGASWFSREFQSSTGSEPSSIFTLLCVKYSFVNAFINLPR
jgi:hypothetical protein